MWASLDILRIQAKNILHFYHRFFEGLTKAAPKHCRTLDHNYYNHNPIKKSVVISLFTVNEEERKIQGKYK